MKNAVIKNLIMASGLILLVGCGSGKTGPAGADGDDGDSGRIVSSTNCSGTIFGLTGAAAALNDLEVAYTSVLTESGDVYTTAHIADDYAQVSGTAFYAQAQNGAATGKVEIIADRHGVDDQGTWEISLNRSSLITTVSYEDDSLNGGTPVVLNFTASACVQNNF